MVPLSWYLGLSALLFTIGAVGVFSETSHQRRIELDLSGCLREQRRLLARIAVLERLLPGRLARAASMEGSRRVTLSPREGEVLELIAQGRTNREIAAELDVTVRTVKTHVEHLFRKLGVTHRTQAVLWAAERQSTG